MTAPGVLDAATKEVLEGKSSVRAAAKNNNIPRITLHDHVKRQREIAAGESVPHCPTRRIFREEEQKLANYIVRAADIYFGLTPREIRLLAYQCAVHFDIKRAEWDAKKIAGKDWFCGFRQRHRPRRWHERPHSTR